MHDVIEVRVAEAIYSKGAFSKCLEKGNSIKYL